jgi:hypothetical protein
VSLETRSSLRGHVLDRLRFSILRWGRRRARLQDTQELVRAPLGLELALEEALELAPEEALELEPEEALGVAELKLMRGLDITLDEPGLELLTGVGWEIDCCSLKKSQGISPSLRFFQFWFTGTTEETWDMGWDNRNIK